MHGRVSKDTRSRKLLVKTRSIRSKGKRVEQGEVDRVLTFGNRFLGLSDGYNGE
jgi:hypothetical protein